MFFADGSGLSRETKREATAFGPGGLQQEERTRIHATVVGINIWDSPARSARTTSINGRTCGSSSRRSRASDVGNRLSNLMLTLSSLLR
jgi:hypothetical protein